MWGTGQKNYGVTPQRRMTPSSFAKNRNEPILPSCYGFFRLGLLFVLGTGFLVGPYHLDVLGGISCDLGDASLAADLDQGVSHDDVLGRAT